MDRVGLKQEHFVIRMTGCPNGCARPYLAELGFVGITPQTYQLWLGGCPNQTRLAQTFIEKLPIGELEATLEPLLVFYQKSRLTRPGLESFGDFCHRVGFAALREFMATYAPQAKRRRYRVDVRDDQYQQLKALAAKHNKSIAALTRDVIAAYLQSEV